MGPRIKSGDDGGGIGAATSWFEARKSSHLTMRSRRMGHAEGSLEGAGVWCGCAHKLGVTPA